MKIKYDEYYQTEDLFGKPFPELIDFYSNLKEKGKLLDLGCGQGRDAIPLARLGFKVTAIDNSKVGIEQLNKTAKKENLPLTGITKDIYDYSDFDQFKFILLNSMLHFGKKEKEKEVLFLNRIFKESISNTLITICIQNIGEKLKILNDVISNQAELKVIKQIGMVYKFEDKESSHSSETEYAMVVVRKK